MIRASAQAGNRTGKTEHYLQWWENSPEWSAETSVAEKRHDFSFRSCCVDKEVCKRRFLDSSDFLFGRLVWISMLERLPCQPVFLSMRAINDRVCIPGSIPGRGALFYATRTHSVNKRTSTRTLPSLGRAVHINLPVTSGRSKFEGEGEGEGAANRR